MTSRTNESPRRRRPHDTIATPDRHSQSCEGRFSPHRIHWTTTMPPSPSNCTVAESPHVIRGRKLSFEDEDFLNGRHGSRHKTQSQLAGKRNRRLKSSMMLFLSLSTLNLLRWRTPVFSYMHRINEVGREQEVDDWSLHQRENHAMTRREIHTKKEARRYAARRNQLAFVSIPKLKRAPLELKLLQLDDKTPRNRTFRVVRLDGKTELLKPKPKRLQDWLLQNETITDESEDEVEATRSQTVVYDNDRDCVPMADWQTTFHVRFPSCSLFHRSASITYSQLVCFSVGWFL